MKNKKGFTLIEVLGVVIILAILLLLSIPQVVKYVQKGKVSYYVSLENEMNTAGANYLEDYRALLPRQVGHVKVVSLDDLVENKYIDEVKDENGDKCTGQVAVKKTKKDSFEYYSCLICGDNGKYYESTNGACDMSEYGNEYADSNEYEIRTVSGTYEFDTDQFSTYTSLNPQVQVLHNGQVIVGNNNDYLEGEPNIVDTKEVGLKQIVYYYHGVTKIVKVNVLDKTNPSSPSVTLKYVSDDPKYNNKIYKNEWYSGDIKATFKSTDYSGKGIEGSGVAYYEVSPNGVDNWTKLSGNTEILTTEGEYTRYVRSTDNNNNVSAVTSYSVKIDKTPPTCTIAGESTDWIKEGSRTIIATCHDDPVNGVNKTSKCKNDTKIKSWTYESSIKTDNISYTMYDEAGNSYDCNNNSTPVNIYIDKEKPTITPKSKPLELKDNVNYTFTSNLTTKDDYSGIKTVTCDPATTQYNCAYDVTCNIEDVAGNTNSTTFRTQHYYNDIAYPATCSREVEYCEERSDETNCCNWAWDNGCAWSGGACAPSQYCVRDGGGDHCCSHGSRSESYDCTKYTCNSSKPANHNSSRHICVHNCGLLCNEKITPVSTELTKTRTIKVTTGHTNGADLQYRIVVNSDTSKNRDWIPISNNGTIKLEYEATAEQPIVVYLKDFSTSCAEVTYTETSIDRTKPSNPTVTLKKDNAQGATYDGNWYKGNIYAQFSSTDNASGIDYYELSLDNKVWAKITDNNVLIEKNGNNTWYVRSTDKVGNISESVEFTTKIDKEKPTTPSIGIQKDNNQGEAYNNGWYSGNVYATFISTDSYSGVNHYEISQDNTNWESLSGNNKLIEVNGDITWYVRTVDNVGNISETNTFVTKIDKEKPSGLSVTLKKNNASGSAYDGNWYKGNVYAKFTSTDSDSGIDHYELTQDDTTWETISTDNKTININGNITWKVKAVDTTGNESDPVEFVTKIDKVAPVVTLDTIINNVGVTKIPYTVTDEYSGVKSITCEYGTTTDYGQTATNNNNEFVWNTSAQTVYYYKITAIDNANNKTEETGETTSGGFNPITITANPVKTKWTTSRTVTITGVTPGADLQYKVIYTSTPEKNVNNWTKIDSGKQLVFDEMTTSNNPITVYARFDDGTHQSEVTEYKEERIDTTKPLVNSGRVQISSSLTTIPLEVSDPESGIEKTVCEYGTTQNGFSEARVETTGNSCSFLNLSKDPTYYYKITTYNKAGLERFMYLFEYTEESQKFVPEITGLYKIEAYGGGGSSEPGSPTKGSYAEGQILLTQGTNMYVYVGGKATRYNGGGQGGDNTHADLNICNVNVNDVRNIRSTNGSGATDIRLEEASESDGWSGNNSLLSRIVTAGGGGGAKRNVGRAFKGSAPQNECYDKTIHLYGYGVDGESSNNTLGQGSSEVFGHAVLTDSKDNGWGASGGGGGGYYGGRTTAVNQSGVYSNVGYCNYNNDCSPCHCGTWHGWVSQDNVRMIGVEVHAYAGTSYVKTGYTYGNRIYTFTNSRTEAGVNNGDGYLKVIEANLESGFCEPVFGDITISTTYDTDLSDILGIKPGMQTYAKSASITITPTVPANAIQYKIGDGSWQDYTGPFIVNKNTTIYAREVGCDSISNSATRVITGIYINASDISHGNTTVQDVFDDIYGRIGE